MKRTDEGVEHLARVGVPESGRPVPGGGDNLLAPCDPIRGHDGVLVTHQLAHGRPQRGPRSQRLGVVLIRRAQVVLPLGGVYLLLRGQTLLLRVLKTHKNT